MIFLANETACRLTWHKKRALQCIWNAKDIHKTAELCMPSVGRIQSHMFT